MLPPCSQRSAVLEFRLQTNVRLSAVLAAFAVALCAAVLGVGSLPWWSRLLLLAVLLAAAARGAARLLPQAHAASVSSVTLEPRSCQMHVRLRDGVQRRAQLCSGSVVLPSAVLLLFKFERGAAVLGPGQRLPGRVCALLWANEHDPRAWRRLHWQLKWPPPHARRAIALHQV